MSRLQLTNDSHKLRQLLVGQLFDIYMIFLYRAERESALIDRFLNYMVLRARSKDEYELDPDNIHPIGDANVCIAFANQRWHVEDFISLLLDAQRVAEKREVIQRYNEATTRGLVDDTLYQDYRYMVDYVHENEFTNAILDNPWLGVHSNRQFLKRYLFWFSIYLDTRIERLACKANNGLLSLGLTVPIQIKVNNMRYALKNILLQYAFGHCSQQEFEDYLREAFESGFMLQEEPDVASEEPVADRLFVASLTHFNFALKRPWLTIRSELLDEEEEEGGDDMIPQGGEE